MMQRLASFASAGVVMLLLMILVPRALDRAADDQGQLMLVVGMLSGFGRIAGSWGRGGHDDKVVASRYGRLLGVEPRPLGHQRHARRDRGALCRPRVAG